MTNNRTWLPKTTVNVAKVVCAILIVLHHTSYYLPDNWFTIITRPIGYLPVGIFLFISGYGLLTSLYRNTMYLNTFLVRRIPCLLIPAITGILVYLLFTEEKFTLQSFLHGLLPYSHYWYVVAILSLYLLFFVVFASIKKKELSVACLWIVLSLYIGVAGAAGIDSYWYYTMYAFSSGALMSLIENEYLIKKTEKQQQLLKKMLVTGSSLIFISTTLIKYGRACISNYNEYCILEFTDVTGVMVLITLLSSSSLPILLFSLRSRSSKKLNHLFLADISYEVYIIHNLFVYLYSKLIGFTYIYEAIYILLSTILAAYLLHLVNVKLLGFVNSVFGGKRQCS